MDHRQQFDFLAAFSPTTAKFLRGRGFPRGGAAGGVSAVTAEDGGESVVVGGV